MFHPLYKLQNSNKHLKISIPENSREEQLLTENDRKNAALYWLAGINAAAKSQSVFKYADNVIKELEPGINVYFIPRPILRMALKRLKQLQKQTDANLFISSKSLSQIKHVWRHHMKRCNRILANHNLHFSVHIKFN